MADTCAACGAPVVDAPGYRQDEGGNFLGPDGKVVRLDEAGRPTGPVARIRTPRCGACGLAAGPPQEVREETPGSAS